jgi:hypothetical protein
MEAPPKSINSKLSEYAKNNKSQPSSDLRRRSALDISYSYLLIGYRLRWSQQWLNVLVNAYTIIMPHNESNVNTWQEWNHPTRTRNRYDPLRVATGRTAYRANSDSDTRWGIQKRRRIVSPRRFVILSMTRLCLSLGWRGQFHGNRFLFLTAEDDAFFADIHQHRVALFELTVQQAYG